MKTLLNIFFLLLTTISIGETMRQDSLNTNAKEEIASKINNVKIPWIQNKGQQQDEVAYYAQTFAGPVFVNQSGDIIYNFKVDSTSVYSIGENFIGANNIQVISGIPSQTKVNYFKGNNPEKWKTNVSTFQSVKLGEVWKGIEVELNAYGNNIEKLFYVKQGANPGAIKVNIKGAKIKDC